MSCLMKNNEKKITYISFLQSFAVFLVLVGHCLPNMNNGLAKPIWATATHHFVYMFHMPLFFIIGGFLLKNQFNNNRKTIYNFKIFCTNKFKKLIIPYFSIGTIAYLLKVFIFNKFAYRPAEVGIIPYIKSFLIPWDNPNIYLWFLPTFFIVSILGFIICKNKVKLKFLIITFIISILSKYTDISILNISGVFYYLFFFVVGAYIFDNKDKFFDVIYQKKNIIFNIIIFVVLYCLPKYDINLLNYLKQIIIALVLINLSFCLSLFFTKSGKKFMFGIFDNTYYQVYLLSWFFQTGTRVFYQLHLINYITVCFFMLLVSIIFSLLINFLIKKYLKFLKIFIGL